MAKQRIIAWLLDDKIDYLVFVNRRRGAEIITTGTEPLDRSLRDRAHDEAFLRIKAAIPEGVRDLELILTGEALDHEPIELPLMNRREIRQLLSRNVKMRSDSSRTLLSWGWMKVGSSIEGGIQKDKVILGVIHHATLLHVLKAAERSGFKPCRAMSIPFIMQTLLHRNIINRVNGNSAVLSVGSSSSHLCMFRQGIFQWYREIPIGVEGVGGESADLIHEPLAALATEIKRSLLFFYQKFGGENITDLQVMGDLPESLTDRFFESLGINVALVKPPEQQLIVKRIKPNNLLNIPSGLALIEQDRTLPNFLPREYFETRTEHSRIAVLTGLFCIIGVLLIAGLMSLNSSIKARQDVELSLEKNIKRFDESLDRHEVLVRTFEKYQEQLAIVAGLPDMGIPDLAVLSGLSTSLTDDLYFERLLIQPRSRQWNVSLSGSLLNGQEAQAYAEFAKFMTRLEGLDLFTELRLKSLEPRWAGVHGRLENRVSRESTEKIFAGVDFEITTELRRLGAGL